MMRTWHSARFASAVVAALLLHAGDALANGAMWDTPQRGAGNILAPSSRFALQKESLDVRAEATEYAASVVYTLTDQAEQQPARAAIMHFPVICSHSEDEEVPAAKSCVRKIEFLVNDKPFRARFVPAREVALNHTLTALATMISEQARRTIHSEAEDFASEYQFYRLDIPADLVVRTLTVRYRAAYNQTAGATSKKAGTGYGPASLIYDFSPASRWAGADTATLDIRIDTSRMRSSPDWNARLWPFVRKGDVLTLSLAHPDFAKLPPLLMQTSNGNYQNHAAFVEDLHRSKAHYQISVIKAVPSRSGHAQIAALTDGNPATYWCWRGPHATLQLTLDTGVIIQPPPTGSEPAPMHRAGLYGLGMLAGSVATRAEFQRFGLPATVLVRKTIRPPASAEGMDTPTAIPLAIMRGDKDRFASFIIFGEENIRDYDFGNGAEAPTLAERTTIPKASYTFDISAVHPRGHTDESCIAELYPVYFSP
jgi:hypothetical protein